MPAKRPTGARNETVQCEACGEYYAVTYKRCPFCEDDEPTRIFRRPKASPEDPVSRPIRPVDEDARDEDEGYEAPPKRRPKDEIFYIRHPNQKSEEEADFNADEDAPFGGKRLVTNARGGGYRHRSPSPAHIIGGVLSVALIVAAIWIVFTIVTSFTGKGIPAPEPAFTPSPSITVSPTPSGTQGSENPSHTEDPNTQAPLVGGQTSAPTPSTSVSPSPTIPVGQTATAFSLGKTEFTLSDTYPTYQFRVTFTPSGSTGAITWASSKSEVVSVDQTGKVTALAKGVATITATMAGGYAQQCMVRSSYGGEPATSSSPLPSVSPSSGGALSFNVKNNDFTLSGVGDTWTLQVKNSTGTPTWSAKDASVATVDANGKVTATGKGTTTITATVDGQTLECVVRVS